MMTEGNDPVNHFEYETGNEYGPTGKGINTGLTKREYFVAMAMQAISNGVFSLSAESLAMTQLNAKVQGHANMAEFIAAQACVIADALIVELNKPVK